MYRASAFLQRKSVLKFHALHYCGRFKYRYIFLRTGKSLHLNYRTKQCAFMYNPLPSFYSWSFTLWRNYTEEVFSSDTAEIHWRYRRLSSLENTRRACSFPLDYRHDRKGITTLWVVTGGFRQSMAALRVLEQSHKRNHRAPGSPYKNQLRPLPRKKRRGAVPARQTSAQRRAPSILRHWRVSGSPIASWYNPAPIVRAAAWWFLCCLSCWEWPFAVPPSRRLWTGFFSVRGRWPSGVVRGRSDALSVAPFFPDSRFRSWTSCRFRMWSRRVRTSFLRSSCRSWKSLSIEN